MAIWSAALQADSEQEIIPRVWALQDGNLTPTYRPFVGHAYALPNPYNGAAPAPCFPRVVNRD
jgi:hypothetical protein